MRVHSFDRIQHIFYALRELRYGSPYYYELRQVEEIMPGKTLASLETLQSGYPTLYAAYVRLLKQDATLANLGFHETVIIAGNNNGGWRSWLEGLRIVTLEAARAGANLHFQRLETRSVSIPQSDEAGFISSLKDAFPGREFDVTLPARGYSYGVIRHRIDMAGLGEVPENLQAHMPASHWASAEFGPWYGPASRNSARDYALESIGIGANGRLYSLPAQTSVTFVSGNHVASSPSDPATLLEKARQARRQAILDRMRAWRTNADEEAKRQEELEAKRSASFQRFEKYRDAKVETDKTMWISTLPFVEAGKGIKSSRRWGIEVETGAGRDLSGVPDQWDSKGDGSLESAYSSGSRYIEPSDCEYSEEHYADEYINELREEEYQDEETGEWKTREVEIQIENPDFIDSYYCESCGDIDSDYYDDEDDDCVELVSPILSSMHSKGLRQICQDIENSPRTDSAGVHVHVEAKDLTVRQIKELVMGYDHIERFLETSYDRRERGYCKRRSARELMQVIRQPEDNVQPREMKTGDRYVTVNLQALYSHGTIEFRAMGPKYNYDHLIRWAMFCREMLNVIANGATSKHFARAKSWNDVLAIFARYGSEYNFATVGQMEADHEFEDIEVTV